MHDLRVNTQAHAPGMRYFPDTIFYFTLMEIIDPQNLGIRVLFQARILHVHGL
jgi:hypothetical protein